MSFYYNCLAECNRIQYLLMGLRLWVPSQNYGAFVELTVLEFAKHGNAPKL